MGKTPQWSRDYKDMRASYMRLFLLDGLAEHLHLSFNNERHEIVEMIR